MNEKYKPSAEHRLLTCQGEIASLKAELAEARELLRTWQMIGRAHGYKNLAEAQHEVLTVAKGLIKHKNTQGEEGA